MNQLTRYIFSFVVYFILQIGLFDHIVLFDVARPFVFILFLLTLPFEWPPMIIYLIAFGSGLMIDLFSSASLSGLHTFSCLLAVGLRKQVSDLAGGSSFRGSNEISFRDQTPLWFVSYLFILILVHHLAFYFLEAMSLAGFFQTLLKVISSSLYTFLFCILMSYLFYKR